ncbi:MAG TPA: protein kinase [Thermoanaerobaculia bacterium]|nr:protein kinase [Thermoanaerobaculia bacterium]
MRSTLGHYRVESVLGRGGMGVVYRGLHESLGRPVAIKALAPELTRQPEFRERFFAEAKTQARLQHPGVVAVYDLLEDGGDFFIVMELVAGVSLDERMQQLAGRGMPVDEAVAIAAQMLAALDYAHSEGVIHRDVKPSNVLIGPLGRVKLMDFGIALLVGDKRLTASQSAIGTPAYMSPEQILRPRDLDHRTDIYSAGVVLYEMLAGRPPFDDETEYGLKKLHVEAPPPDLHALRPVLPPGVVEAIVVALAKEPDARFDSAGLFLRALQEAAPMALPGSAATPAVVAPVPPGGGVRRPAAASWAGRSRAATRAALSRLRAAGRGLVSPVLGHLAPVVGPGAARWVALAAAALLVAGAAGVLALAFGGSEEVPGTVAEAALGATAGEALALAPTPRLLLRPMAAGLVGPGSELPIDPSNLPLVAPEPEPPGEGDEAATPATPRPAPPPRRPVAVPRTEPEPVREPAEASRQQAAPRPATEAPDEATGSTGGALDRQELGQLILRIERLSHQVLEAYEREGRDDQLLDRLDVLPAVAETTRKEFRRVTGTGLPGLKQRLLGRDRRDEEKLVLAVADLAHRADEIDRLVTAHTPAPSTQQLWRELLREVRRLQQGL